MFFCIFSLWPRGGQVIDGFQEHWVTGVSEQHQSWLESMFIIDTYRRHWRKLNLGRLTLEENKVHLF